MEKVTTLPLVEKTEIEKAKELIATEEKKQVELAQAIYEEAANKISDLGFKLEPAGQFQGNKLETTMLLVKK